MYERVVRVNNRDNLNTVTKEEYREKIMEMVNGIENIDYLFKIYHYIIAKYRREKEKEAEY